jgi:hypothetical protein
MCPGLHVGRVAGVPAIARGDAPPVCSARTCGWRLGVIPGLDEHQRSGAAQLQSALTHGHPTALAPHDG